MNFICGPEKRDKRDINYILLHVSVSISFMTLILEKLVKFLVLNYEACY